MAIGKPCTGLTKCLRQLLYAPALIGSLCGAWTYEHKIILKLTQNTARAAELLRQTARCLWCRQLAPQRTVNISSTATGKYHHLLATRMQ